MPTKLSDIATSLLAATASDAGLQLAGKWINDRYVEFCARTRLHQLRHLASVDVPAPLSAGTVNVTQGSASVVGTGTAFTQAQVGWFIRAAVVWYKVIRVSAQTLTLETAYSESSNTAATYQLVQRYTTVDSSARWLGEFAHPRLGRPLNYMPWHLFQTTYPRRTLVGAYPWCWTEAPHYGGQTPSIPTQGKQVEIYPPSTIIETYTYSFWAIPDNLNLESFLPNEVDSYVLREGALIDHYRYQSERALQAATPNVELFNAYKNMEARQRAVWEKAIQDAIQADSAGRQDVTLVLDPYGRPASGYGDPEDITNAHQQVIYSWTM